MIDIRNQKHLVQTKKWNSFKKEYGRAKVDKVGGVYMLIKKIPFTNFYLGFSPKVNFLEQSVDFIKIEKYCKKNNISFIRFDVPNILKNTAEGNLWEKKLKDKGKKSPRNTFTVENIYLDLTKDIDSILKEMHPKKRYNIRYAIRKGVEIKISQKDRDLEDFWKLHYKTSKRQMFLTYPKKYFEKMHQILGKDVYYIKAFVNKNLATVWMIITTKDTIYYTFGGSDSKWNKYYPNDLVGFEAIKLGKRLNKKYFDMWGAEKGKGFTEFKLKYGAEKLRFLDSYDIVYKKIPYYLFNTTYGLFWKAQYIKRKIKKIGGLIR